MITPQTNTTLTDIAGAITQGDHFIISGHINPDGDCLGSQLALACALERMGKQVACILAEDRPLDASLSFIPGSEKLVPARFFKGRPGVFITVDVPTRERLGKDAARLLDACALSITLDHHAVETTMADLVYVDTDAASTTLLVWELCEIVGVSRAGQLARCCYCGLVSDTGRFQYQNTSARAFVAAAEMVEQGANPAAIAGAFYQNRSHASLFLEACMIEHIRFGLDGAFALSWLAHDDFVTCKATRSDAEMLIDTLRCLQGVQVACLLRDVEGIIRGSLRAKDDTDVARIARLLGGGGHRAAAGFTLELSLTQAREKLYKLLSDALPSGSSIAQATTSADGFMAGEAHQA